MSCPATSLPGKPAKGAEDAGRAEMVVAHASWGACAWNALPLPLVEQNPPAPDPKGMGKSPGSLSPIISHLHRPDYPATFPFPRFAGGGGTKQRAIGGAGNGGAYAGASGFSARSCQQPRSSVQRLVRFFLVCRRRRRQMVFVSSSLEGQL
jgi:hypothetical protein